MVIINRMDMGGIVSSCVPFGNMSCVLRLLVLLGPEDGRILARQGCLLGRDSRLGFLFNLLSGQAIFED